MKIPQTQLLPTTISRSNNNPSYIVFPPTCSTGDCPQPGGLLTSNGFTPDPSYLGQQQQTAVIIEQPQDNFAGFKKLLALIALSIVGGQVLSKVPSNKNVARLYKQGSTHLTNEGSVKSLDQFHVFFPGNGVDKKRQMHALDLSRSIGQPVHTLHIGTEPEKNGFISRSLNAIRSGLNVLNERLGYMSPWGGGYELAVDRGIEAIAQAVKEKNNPNLEVHLHGHSIGGSIAAQIAAAAKNDPRLNNIKFVSLNTYGAPISKSTEDYLKQDGLTINSQMNLHDPIKYFRKADNPFNLIVRAYQAGKMALEKGLTAHSFNSYVPSHKAA